MMNCPRCDKPIDEHEAGRDTDACVAKVVMGETPFQPRDRYAGISYGDKWFLEAAYPNFPGASMPHYSLYIAAAWKVHETQTKKLFSKRRMYLDAIERELCEREKHVVAWPDALLFLSPLAICRAALKATVKEFA